MSYSTTTIHRKLKEIEIYIASTRISLENHDTVAPQGHLYMISALSNEIINELKKIPVDV